MVDRAFTRQQSVESRAPIPVRLQRRNSLYICLYYTSNLLSQLIIQKKEKKVSRRVKPGRTKLGVKQALT